MATRLEVLTGRPAGGHNRKWPDEAKARIVAETPVRGATVNEVAARHGLKANHLSSWRTMARRGRLVLPAPEHEVEFAAMVVAASPPENAAAGDSAGIIMGSVTIRLAAGASAERIAEIARALAATE